LGLYLIMQRLLTETNCNRIPNRFLIKEDIPFAELVETAKQEKVDRVVMGTKVRGNIAGILMGSQAEKMFRHCPVPLLSKKRMKCKRKRAHGQGHHGPDADHRHSGQSAGSRRADRKNAKQHQQSFRMVLVGIC